MPHHSRDTLELFPQPSRALRVFIVVSHLLAVGVCTCLISRNYWASVLPLPVLYSGFYFLRLQSNECGRRVVRIVWTAGGQWHWYTQAGTHAEGRHLASSVRLPWLVILHLRSEPQGQFAAIVLPYDRLPADQHRRLRVRLNIDSIASPE